MLALARDNDAAFRATLLASVNFGGDNVHRTAVLGMLMGAAHDELPGELLDGLADAGAIGEEIDALVR